MRLSPRTLKQYSELTPEQKQNVDRLVKRHLHALFRNGFHVENLDRVFTEAIDVVLVTETKGIDIMEPNGRYEPRISYDQYTTPKDKI